ncbi:hypothetical protein [Geothrix fuzhouensis]|uniref:hypothetical protein n=1 Tax=Geothrix fuzhouensis TaxID=2966451 RepID=UPI0021494913|nr:hypothetical protein [Geothrix fuzhouensis]
MTMRTFFALAFMALTLGCSRVSSSEARMLVARYNQVVSEAYRKNDVRLIDEVVGPDAPDGRRLLGLIGVRMDMGLTLDARLENLEVTKVEQAADSLQVHTREQWRYRDVQTATGRQVGEASVDHYEMLYRFSYHKGTWLVEETKFTAPPQVGRKEVPWNIDAKDAHGMITAPATQGAKP